MLQIMTFPPADARNPLTTLTAPKTQFKPHSLLGPFPGLTNWNKIIPFCISVLHAV